MPETLTLAEIANALRRMFPNAVSVEMFVNQTEHSITPTYKDASGPEHGASYRTLSGEWAHHTK